MVDKTAGRFVGSTWWASPGPALELADLWRQRFKDRQVSVEAVTGQAIMVDVDVLGDGLGVKPDEQRPRRRRSAPRPAPRATGSAAATATSCAATSIEATWRRQTAPAGTSGRRGGSGYHEEWLIEPGSRVAELTVLIDAIAEAS
jgi:hypothetical protein